MTPLHQREHPSPPADEMARLVRFGFSLVPLGDNGKVPLCKFKDRPQMPLKQVLGRMHSSRSSCYGILLPDLVVVDCDEDDSKLIAQMEARFGKSPVQVKTPRGQHMYYRAGSGEYPNLKREDLPIDIKQGPNSYVVGPGSIRPDGGEYVSMKAALGIGKLPIFPSPPPVRVASAKETDVRDQISSPTNAPKIPVGKRNRALFNAAIQMVELVDSPDELLGHLIYMRDNNCASPQSVSDAELSRTVRSAWSIRLEGNVYQGRASQFRLQRDALDAIKKHPNASDAVALFVTLQDQHGHRSGQVFPLSHDAMKKAGHTDLSRDRFRAARRTLERAGLLRIASKHHAGNTMRTYRLIRLRSEIAVSENVLELLSP